MIIRILGFLCLGIAAALVMMQLISSHNRRKREERELAEVEPVAVATDVFMAELRLQSVGAPADFSIVVDSPDFAVLPRRVRDPEIYRGNPDAYPKLESLDCRIVKTEEGSRLVVASGNVTVNRGGRQVALEPASPLRLALDDRIRFGAYEFQVKSANLKA